MVVAGTKPAARRQTNAGAVPAGPNIVMSFLLYFVGFVVFISGLAWVATLAGLSQSWILAGAALLLAIGVFTAVARTRESAA